MSKIGTTIPKGTTSVPPSVAAKIERGTPKRLAMATGRKPATTVKV